MQFSALTVALFAALTIASPIQLHARDEAAWQALESRVTSAEKAAAKAGSCGTTAAPAAATSAAASASTAAPATSGSTATGGSVLTAQAYNDFQISDGSAGDGETRANAIFANVPTDLASVSAADLKIIAGVHDVAEDAEVGAFNPAIDAAGGTKAAPDLQNGKIKNKILKLTATVLKLKIQAAQGKDTAADLAAESKKLANNIALDTAAAGQKSTAVPFTGTS